MKILSVFPEPAREELVNWLLMFPQHPRGFGSSATAKVFFGQCRREHKTVLWKVSFQRFLLDSAKFVMPSRWKVRKKVCILYIYTNIYMCISPPAVGDILRAYSLFSRLCTVGPYRSFPGISISESQHVAVLSRAEAISRLLECCLARLSGS